MNNAPNPRHSLPLEPGQAALVAEHRRLARWWAARMTRGRPHLLEGAEDAALDGLIRAARAFGPAIGVTFSRFARDYIRHAVTNHFRYLGRARRGGALATVPLDAPGAERAATVGPKLPDFGPDFEGLIAVADLAPREQALVRLRFRDDLTLQAAGDRIGLSRGRAWQLEKQSLERIRAALA